MAEECQLYDIPFLVEPVSYPIGEEVGNPRQFAKIKSQVVIQTARDITSLPIDVLKAEFPADLKYEADESKLGEFCAELDRASQKPWVILSAGADFETFIKEVELACRNWASGFLAGRAVWQEAVTITDAALRHKFLSAVATERLQRLAEITHKYATPWYKNCGLTTKNLTEIAPGWHSSYEALP